MGASRPCHTATLQAHVAAHSRQDFVDVNLTGTLNLLEEAAQPATFVYTHPACSAMRWCHRLASRRRWITSVTAVPKNIYGVTKAAAEDLCQLFAQSFAARHRAAP